MAAESPGSRFEATARAALVAGVAAAGVLAVASVFLLTLGFDEAWVLIGLRDLVAPRHPDLVVDPVASHGGLFALVHLLIASLAGGTLWVHRAVSLAGLATILFCVARWLRPRLPSRDSFLIAAAAVLGAPGTLVLSATALGSALATAVALSAVLAWDACSGSRPRRWIVCGVLAGLAAASRLEWLMLVPGLAVWSLAGRVGRRERLVDAAATAAVAGVVFGACLLWITKAASHPDSTLAASAGMGRSLLDYPRTLNRFLIGDAFLPAAIVIVAGAAAWLAGRDGDAPLPSWTALVPCGALIWAAWLVQSPIPHLRYLWPAIVCFAVVLGIALADLYERGIPPGVRPGKTLVLLAGAAWVLSADVVGLRALVVGDSDELSFEWSREVRMPNYRRFRCVQDQRDAVAHAQSSFGEDEVLPCIGGGLPLRLLSGRRVVSFSDLITDTGRPRSPLPRRFVITPGVGTYVQLPARASVWIEDHCVLEAQFGRYCFYRVKDDYPADLRVLVPVLVDAPQHPLAAGLQFNTR